MIANLNFIYKKFIGIGVFSKQALKIFNDTPRSKLESIEESDLIRFLEKGVKVKMMNVNCESLSVDTIKDLEYVRSIISLGGGTSKVIIPLVLLIRNNSLFTSGRRCA